MYTLLMIAMSLIADHFDIHILHRITQPVSAQTPVCTPAPASDLAQLAPINAVTSGFNISNSASVLGNVMSQSSTLYVAQTSIGPALNANDASLSTVSLTHWELSPWLQFDMIDTYPVARVVIYNAPVGLDRMAGVRVYVGNYSITTGQAWNETGKTQCSPSSGSTSATVESVNCYNVTSRFVHVMLPSKLNSTQLAAYTQTVNATSLTASQSASSSLQAQSPVNSSLSQLSIAELVVVALQPAASNWPVNNNVAVPQLDAVSLRSSNATIDAQLITAYGSYSTAPLADDDLSSIYNGVTGSAYTWVRLDLQECAPYGIDRVQVWNLQSTQALEMIQQQVWISNVTDLAARSGASFTSGNKTACKMQTITQKWIWYAESADCGGQVARYLWIVCTRPRAFQVAEVKVYKRTVPASQFKRPLFCMAGFCQNGGTCQELLAGWQCVCTQGWTGIHCLQRSISNPLYATRLMIEGAALTQSSTLSGDASFAGNFAYNSVYNTSATVTRNDTGNVEWFQLDLTDRQSIVSVIIYVLDDPVVRLNMANYTVYVSDTPQTVGQSFAVPSQGMSGYVSFSGSASSSSFSSALCAQTNGPFAPFATTPNMPRPEVVQCSMLIGRYVAIVAPAPNVSLSIVEVVVHAVLPSSISLRPLISHRPVVSESSQASSWSHEQFFDGDALTSAKQGSQYVALVPYVAIDLQAAYFITGMRSLNLLSSITDQSTWLARNYSVLNSASSWNPEITLLHNGNPAEPDLLPFVPYDRVVFTVGTGTDINKYACVRTDGDGNNVTSITNVDCSDATAFLGAQRQVQVAVYVYSTMTTSELQVTVSDPCTNRVTGQQLQCGQFNGAGVCVANFGTKTASCQCAPSINALNSDCSIMNFCSVPSKVTISSAAVSVARSQGRYIDPTLSITSYVSPCQNGAVCINRPDTIKTRTALYYDCACSAGWSGVNCTAPISGWSPTNDCINGSPTGRSYSNQPCGQPQPLPNDQECSCCCPSNTCICRTTVPR